MTGLYTLAVKTGPDGGWVDVPVTEGRYSYEPIRPGDSGEIWTTRDDLPTGKRRPVSWALILPGDTVLWGEDRFTVISTHETGSVDLWTPDEQPSGRPAGWHTTGFAGRSCTDELTLVCTDEIPEHRASHPAWQWPT